MSPARKIVLNKRGIDSGQRCKQRTWQLVHESNQTIAIRVITAYVCTQCPCVSSWVRLDRALVDWDVALEADELEHFGPETDRRCCKGSLVCVNQRSVPDKIDLVWLEPLSPLENLPEDEEYGSEDDHGVVGNESLSGKVAGLEGRVTVDKDDYNLEDEGDPGAVWLEITAVRKRLAVKTLRLAGLEEAEVCDTHDNVVDDTTSGDDVGEPR